MAFSKEVLDTILMGYRGPDDFYGPEGIMKQLTKALVERAMEASNLRFALTGRLGYEKHDQGEKPIANRRDGKSAKEPRTDGGPINIEIPRDREGSFEPQIVPKRHEKRSFSGIPGV
jgi:transposase-like protein